MKLVQLLTKDRIGGFTLIELMIAVAIVGVLAAVAIPAYQGYIRRSYLNEVPTSISAIKSAEESYFSINNCYISADATPSTIPAGTTTAWPTSPSGAWAQNALGVRPDRQVRFQYLVYAPNTVGSSGSCDAGAAAANCTSTGTSSIKCSRANIDGLALGCVSNIGTTLVPNAVFGTNWYVINVRGNLDNDTVTSNFISAIDDTALISCNEVE